MTLFIVLLILALIIFGVGFAVHLLWWLLIIVLVIAVFNWLFGRPRAGGASSVIPAGRRSTGFGRAATRQRRRSRPARPAPSRWLRARRAAAQNSRASGAPVVAGPDRR